MKKIAAAMLAVLTGATLFLTTNPAPAEAQFRSTIRYQVRRIRLPRTGATAKMLAVWVFSAQTGRIRLCAIADIEQMAGSLKCSAWQGGGEPGRYSMQQAYTSVRAGGAVVVGTWVFNYATGRLRACAASDLKDLASSFKCSNEQ